MSSITAKRDRTTVFLHFRSGSSDLTDHNITDRLPRNGSSCYGSSLFGIGRTPYHFAVLSMDQLSVFRAQCYVQGLCTRGCTRGYVQLAVKIGPVQGLCTRGCVQGPSVRPLYKGLCTKGYVHGAVYKGL